MTSRTRQLAIGNAGASATLLYPYTCPAAKRCIFKTLYLRNGGTGNLKPTLWIDNGSGTVLAYLLEIATQATATTVMYEFYVLLAAGQRIGMQLALASGASGTNYYVLSGAQLDA